MLANTAPLWVGLGTLIFFRKRLSSGFWIGTVIALLGAGLVLGLELDGQTIGLLLGLIAAVFYAGLFPGYPTWPGEVGFAKLFLVSSHEFGGGAPGIQLGIGPAANRIPSLNLSNLPGDGSDYTDPRLLLDHFALGHLPASIVAPSLLGAASDYRHPGRPLLGEAFSSLQILGGLAVLAGVFVVVRSQGGAAQ